MTKPKPCATCSRNANKVNTEWSECSHVDCPNRRSIMFERVPRTEHHELKPQPTIDRHFDKADK